MTFLDLKNDFYRPLWIRVVLLCILFGWGLFEFVTGAPFWGVIFCGVGAVALWQWFFSGWPDTSVNGNSPRSSANHDSDAGDRK